MSDFNLNIFTPNGIVVEGLKSSSLTIPTSKGEINVLPGHTHIVSELETGILSAQTNSGVRRFSITSGLVKVLGNDVNILSTTTEKAEDIDQARAQAAQKKAVSRLASKEAMLTDVDRIKFQRKLDRARMRIRLHKLLK
ncbi:MAG: ATP synthase F1 subunit epsilon [Bacteriovoracaceae bacterium]|jgi:F-type H+-transporting ATPase subunit epsilon|nr:ATP synthase F1 subunit epsilon [Bacteriovoracaceae bacterium]